MQTYDSCGWQATHRSHHGSPRSDRRPTLTEYTGRCYSETIRAHSPSDHSLARQSRHRSPRRRHRSWTTEYSWDCHTETLPVCSVARLYVHTNRTALSYSSPAFMTSQQQQHTIVLKLGSMWQQNAKLKKWQRLEWASYERLNFLSRF